MDAEEKEILRHGCLDFLVIRHPAALPVRAIRRGLTREVSFEVHDNDVEAACQFLVGLGHAQPASDPLGATKYFSATSQGVLARERGMNPQPNQTRE